MIVKKKKISLSTIYLDVFLEKKFPNDNSWKNECVKDDTPDKNNLFRKSNARTNELRHENSCIKSSSRLRGEHCKFLSDFFPSECPAWSMFDIDQGIH